MSIGGTLDREEVATLSLKLGRAMTDEELNGAMAEMDPNGDGAIIFPICTRAHAHTHTHTHTHGRSAVLTLFYINMFC